MNVEEKLSIRPFNGYIRSPEEKKQSTVRIASTEVRSINSGVQRASLSASETYHMTSFTFSFSLQCYVVMTYTIVKA